MGGKAYLSRWAPSPLPSARARAPRPRATPGGGGAPDATPPTLARGPRPEEWDWLIEHGDPQTATFELLEAIAFREVPEAILLEAWGELEEGITLAES
jgi:hypothetical protein